MYFLWRYPPGQTKLVVSKRLKTYFRIVRWYYFWLRFVGNRGFIAYVSVKIISDTEKSIYFTKIFKKVFFEHHFFWNFCLPPKSWFFSEKKIFVWKCFWPFLICIGLVEHDKNTFSRFIKFLAKRENWPKNALLMLIIW